MKLTYYGHSCFSVETGGGKTLLFDPFVSQSPTASAAGIAADKLAADYILVTHGHVDHVGDAKDIACRTGAPVVACNEVCNWLVKDGVEEVRRLHIGGTADLGGVRAKFVPVAHASVMPDGSHGGAAGGFYVKSEEGSFYYPGDTGLTAEFAMVPSGLTFAVLPIGGTFTMDVEDAVLAAQMLQVQTVVGVHYDTLPQIMVDHEAAVQAFADAGIQLLLLPIGGSVDL